MDFVGAGGAGDFVLDTCIKFFVLPCVSVLKNTQNFVENSKMGEKHTKIFLTPT